MKEQLKRGKAHEYELDDYFRSQGWDIEELTRQQERNGLGDRRFCRNGETYLIEYKSDETASRTGNAFIETISVDTANKPGWGYTCKADYLFYYLPIEMIIYIFKPDNLRRVLPGWKNKYPTRPTGKGQNKGYRTWGVLVPLWELEEHADKIINL